MALTQKDLKDIEEIVDRKVDEKTKLLPTKDEFFGKMDEVMGELKTIREEQSVMVGQISDTIDRVEKLEEVHPNGKHSTL